MMKAIMAIVAALFLTQAFADAPAPPASPHKSNASVHRYLVERTFPHGALDGLDAATKQKVNANNSSVGVRWIESYATADKTKTYCIYEGPNEAAVRKAATLNALPVDSIVEVPVTLLPN
jgi:Protein of unknown function (DUF4242)